MDFSSSFFLVINTDGYFSLTVIFSSGYDLSSFNAILYRGEYFLINLSSSKNASTSESTGIVLIL